MIEIANEVAKAARAVSFEWPGVIDAEDLQQEIWVKLLESAEYVNQLNAMDGTQRYAALKLIGNQVASSYRADYALFSGNIHYGTAEVRSLLESGILATFGVDLLIGDTVVAREMYGSGVLEDDSYAEMDGSFSRLYEAWNDKETTLTEYLDITVGLTRLADKNRGHVNALIGAYAIGKFDRSTAAKRVFLQRAVDNLTACMNAAHRRRHVEYENGPGSRKSISNARANTERQA